MSAAPWFAPTSGSLSAAGCVLLLLPWVAGQAWAQADVRRWDGQSMTTLAVRNSYAAWHPQNQQGANSPGWKVMFFGDAASCPLPKGVDGPLARPGESQLTELGRLTGIAPRPGALAWSPLASAAVCGVKASGLTDDSGALLVGEGQQSGVGLLTSSGTDAKGSLGFLGPFASNGQNGAGANAGIEGSFVTLREDWQAPDALRPWRDGGMLTVDSIQGVPTLRLDTPAGVAPVQAKQQLTLGFVNRKCVADGVRPGRPCQFKLLLTLAISRAGVSDWRQVGWFQRVRVMFDPAQGGLPVLDGPVPEAGEMALAAAGDLPLYQSTGAATQHLPFDRQRFSVTMRFAELTNGLRVIAEQGRRQAPNKSRGPAMADLFGPAWDDPDQWALMQTTLGQEVVNPDPSRQVAIGGHMRSLEIRSVMPR